MIPLVGMVKELRDQKVIVDRVAADVMKEQGIKIKYLVGTMIEVPRGALTADRNRRRGAVLLVRHERPDAAHVRLLARRCGKFLRIYQDKKILERDPFASIDVDGVGKLVGTARRARAEDAAKDLKLGICGEHGGDPASIHFFDKVGLDYVSMSPYRVPVARLAAAQAALSVKHGD